MPITKIMNELAAEDKQEKENALTFIRKNALDLIDLLPEGAITESASENLLGTSTGVPKSLLNRFYTKQDRITKGAGLSPYTKNKNISKKDFLEAFGVIEGRKSTDFGPRTPEAQAVKSMMSLYGKLATNSIVREELIKSGELQSVVENIAAGKSTIQFSQTVRGQFDLKLKGRAKVDTLLTENKLDKTLDLKKLILTKNGRRQIIKLYRENIFILLPRAAWQQRDQFTSSNQNYGISISKGTKQEVNAFKKLKRDLKKEIKNAPDSAFGKDVLDTNGKPINFKISTYGTIFS